METFVDSVSGGVPEIDQNDQSNSFNISGFLLVKYSKERSHDVDIHKYYESQKTHKDVGPERAYIHWMGHGHARALLERFINNQM